MSIEKEILKQIVDYYIILSEINDTVTAKNNAIRKQSFEEAAKMREREKDLLKSLPSSDYFKDM